MGSERGILQTVQFAEEIDFPRDARADAVLAARHRLAGRRYTLWDPAPLSAALHLKRRDERSAGNLVLRARLFDFQRRDAQIAVVAQRDVNQRLYARVSEKVTPAGFFRFRRAKSRIVRSNGRCGTLIARLQCTGAQKCNRRNRVQAHFKVLVQTFEGSIFCSSRANKTSES